MPLQKPQKRKIELERLLIRGSNDRLSAFLVIGPFLVRPNEEYVALFSKDSTENAPVDDERTSEVVHEISTILKESVPAELNSNERRRGEAPSESVRCRAERLLQLDRRSVDKCAALIDLASQLRGKVDLATVPIGVLVMKIRCMKG